MGLCLALPLAGCRTEAPPSVLLVVVDTLRADQVGALRPEGSPRPGSTPCVDRFARGAAVFRRATTPAPFTMPAMAAAMTGAWPDRTGVIAHEPGITLAEWKGRTLAESARRSGLATAAVVANPWLARGGTGFDRGFDRFSRVYHSGQAPGASSATVVTDEAIRVLDDLAGRRFLMWVHYFDPHMPYTPPARFAQEAGASPEPSRVMADFDTEGRDLARLYAAEGYSPGDIEQARRLYEGEVRYVDDEIGRLLAHVEQLGLDDGTLVIIASDHGEALGEHGLYFAHDYTLYDELLHTPLLLKGPGIPAGTRDDAVSLVDLATTLCRAAALDCDGAVDGRDLFAAPDPQRALFAAATARRSKGTPFPALDVDGPDGRWTMILRGGTKLLRMPSSKGTRLAMYDLARDPGERHDLVAEGRADSRALQELSRQLDAWRTAMDTARPPVPAHRHARRRARDENALRSLGYLQ